MAKTWATKCCSGTYKNNYQLCCGIKDLCIALVATIWAYVKRDSFLFNDKI